MCYVTEIGIHDRSNKNIGLTIFVSSSFSLCLSLRKKMYKFLQISKSVGVVNEVKGTTEYNVVLLPMKATSKSDSISCMIVRDSTSIYRIIRGGGARPLCVTWEMNGGQTVWQTAPPSVPSVSADEQKTIDHKVLGMERSDNDCLAWWCGYACKKGCPMLHNRRRYPPVRDPDAPPKNKKKQSNEPDEIDHAAAGVTSTTVTHASNVGSGHR